MNAMVWRFAARSDGGYDLDISLKGLGRASAAYHPPYEGAALAAILEGLQPGGPDDAIRPAVNKALAAVGLDLARLPEQVGRALGRSLTQDTQVELLLERALHAAGGVRETLPVILSVGQGCEGIMALPWELVQLQDMPLVRRGLTALIRWPRHSAVPSPSRARLPLRVLLVLSEPLDANPTLSDATPEMLAHGLSELERRGAAFVDTLWPPTFPALVEALSSGLYHVLVYYGHGAWWAERQCGALLFETGYGTGDLVPAAELGDVLYRSQVRLAILSACRSAQTQAGGRNSADLWAGVAPALVRAGVPYVLGMQTNLRVDAAQALLRQLFVSLARGTPVCESVADARQAIMGDAYGAGWYIPALYGRPRAVSEGLFASDDALSQEDDPLRQELARQELAQHAARVAELEAMQPGLARYYSPAEIAELRSARAAYRQARQRLSRAQPAGAVRVTSPLYGVPTPRVFVGRAQELEQAAYLLEEGSPLVLWGPGGIGKTTLAAALAARQGWRYPGGVLWLNCQGAMGLASLLPQMAAFCGVQLPADAPADQARAAVRGALAGLEPCLLVWDNAEDIWEQREVREFVYTLPRPCGVMLTTRENPNETAWNTLEVEPLKDEAMHALFVRLADAAGVKVAGKQDALAIPQIIAYLEGLPKAVELLVPLARQRGLARTWREMQQQPLRGLAAVFETSYARRTALQQALFERLSVLRIPFERELAYALGTVDGAEVTAQALAWPPPPVAEIDDALDALADAALLAFDGAYHRMHGLLRQYGYAKLAARGAEAQRAAHLLAAQALQAKIRSGEPVSSEEVLQEVDQWRWAEAWETHAQRASDLVGSLDRLGYYGPIAERLEGARQLAQEHHLSGATQAQVLLRLGSIRYRDARMEPALSAYQQALDLFRAVGDRLGEANTLKAIGDVQQFRKEIAAALDSYRQALDLFRAVGARLGEANTLQAIGDVQQFRDDHAAALDSYRQALDLFRAVGDRLGEANTLQAIGDVQQFRKEIAAALDSYRQALALFRAVGDRLGEANTLKAIGDVQQFRKEIAAALDSYRQALALFRAVGDRLGEANTLKAIGDVQQFRKEIAAALDSYRQALDLFRAVGARLGEANTLKAIGDVQQFRKEIAAALDSYRQALDLFRAVGARLGEANTLQAIGDVQQFRDDRDAALDSYRQALDLFRAVGDRLGEANTLQAIGSYHLAAGDGEQASECLSQAMALYEAVGSRVGQANTCWTIGIHLARNGALAEAQPWIGRAVALVNQIAPDHPVAAQWAGVLEQVRVALSQQDAGPGASDDV